MLTLLQPQYNLFGSKPSFSSRRHTLPFRHEASIAERIPARSLGKHLKDRLGQSQVKGGGLCISGAHLLIRYLYVLVEVDLKSERCEPQRAWYSMSLPIVSWRPQPVKLAINLYVDL